MPATRPRSSGGAVPGSGRAHAWRMSCCEMKSCSSKDCSTRFAFARMNPDGTLAWSDSWTDAQSLPRLVKLKLRERVSGIDLFGGAEFIVHADAPAACARAGASADCVKGTQPGAPGAARPQQEPEEGTPLGRDEPDEPEEGPQP